MNIYKRFVNIWARIVVGWYYNTCVDCKKEFRSKIPEWAFCSNCAELGRDKFKQELEDINKIYNPHLYYQLRR